MLEVSLDQWVLTKSGRLYVALVDVEYLDKLIRYASFNELAVQSHAAFDDYLRHQGLDPDTISEDEVKVILAAV